MSSYATRSAAVGLAARYSEAAGTTSRASWYACLPEMDILREADGNWIAALYQIGSLPCATYNSRLRRIVYISSMPERVLVTEDIAAHKLVHGHEQLAVLSRALVRVLSCAVFFRHNARNSRFTSIPIQSLQMFDHLPPHMHQLRRRNHLAILLPPLRHLAYLQLRTLRTT